MSIRRLWPSGAAARAGVVAVLVLALLVVADRATALIAQSKVAGELADGIHCVTGAAVSPSVSIGGFPFLAELATGTFGSIRIRAEDLDLGGEVPIALQSVAIEAKDVKAPRGDRPGRIGRVSAQATVPWSVLPAELAGRHIRYGATADGLLSISTSMKVSVLPVPVTVLASVQLEGSAIAVHPQDIRILGIRKSLADLDRGLGAWLARDAPDSADETMKNGAQQELPPLPAGLTYSSATVGETGLTITMTGRDLDASQFETENCRTG